MVRTESEGQGPSDRVASMGGDLTFICASYATRNDRRQDDKDIGTINLKEGGNVTHKEDMQISSNQANNSRETVRLDGVYRRGTTICGAGLDQPGHVTWWRILAGGEHHQRWWTSTRAVGYHHGGKTHLRSD